ncbi:MAG TPA: tRNA (adenosine(37)-N6)-threonylcarbamoyltransferase complex dimerization subunit type 1 TsaB [Candidatus Binatia bacterium]|nr:tRNA (adenosine(37)-N6)-threonylcarbamoyltransferase complex dimerization subunit type 1 TsaB [Candidatus Binatia bacterium]
MFLLITDTSGGQGRVALARAGEDGRIEIIEEAPLSGGAFSAQLVPQIAMLLEKHALSKADVDAFVVVSGPGSFTGLRVGLAGIKALAEILRKPIVPVSLLEVIAQAGRHEGKVVAALDAGRGEVYAGEYDITAQSAKVCQEKLVSKNEFLSLRNGSVIATPVPSLAEAAKAAKIPVLVIDEIRSEMIAQVGWKKLRAGETVTPEKLEANYIRHTDAEIFAKPSSS